MCERVKERVSEYECTCVCLSYDDDDDDDDDAVITLSSILNLTKSIMTRRERRVLEFWSFEFWVWSLENEDTWKNLCLSRIILSSYTHTLIFKFIFIFTCDVDFDVDVDVGMSIEYVVHILNLWIELKLFTRGNRVSLKTSKENLIFNFIPS